MKDKIPLLDLVAQYKQIKPEIDEAIQDVLDSGWFILGEEVQKFEREVADYLGAKHAVGVASGTDALILGLRAYGIGPGDEVIIPAYTFFATAGAVLHVGAKPVLADIDPDTYCLNIEQVKSAVSLKTKAIIPVHLYGHPADMDPLLEIAETHDIKVIEDNAQAFGAEYKGQKTGALGDLSCLSFFPSKNLGGYGDGGMVVTNSDHVAEKVRMLRVHGWKQKYHPKVLGYNSRLDAIQAAVLRVKIDYVDKWNKERREIADHYTDNLNPIESLKTPIEKDYAKHVYHLYILQSKDRDHIQEKLNDRKIASGIYYPKPLHLTDPCKALGYMAGDFPVSEKASKETWAIPIYPDLKQDEINRIIESLIEIL